MKKMLAVAFAASMMVAGYAPVAHAQAGLTVAQVVAICQADPVGDACVAALIANPSIADLVIAALEADPTFDPTLLAAIEESYAEQTAAVGGPVVQPPAGPGPAAPTTEGAGSPPVTGTPAPAPGTPS